MSDATTSLPRLAAPRPGLKKLRQDAIRTASRASALLPSILDRIEERIPSMEDKQLVSAGHLLAGMAQHRALVAQKAGLLKGSQASSAPQTIVNVSIRQDLPISERIKLIQAEVSGVPMILPAPPVVLDASPAAPEALSVDFETKNDSEPVPDPENDARALQARLDDL